MDEEFEKMQRVFCNSNCMHFEATEENKLIYTDIFKKYTDTVENYLTKKLTEAIPEFNMEAFLTEVSNRTDEIDEPLMDLLLSFSEFESFKEMMLFARAHLVATTPKPRSGKAAALGLKDHVEQVQPTHGAKLQIADVKYFESCIDQLSLVGTATKVHHNETEDGIEIPDLNL